MDTMEAVFFDLFETLITEFDPNWKRRPSVPERLGVDPEVFRAEWRARRTKRHTGAFPDYPSVLREICEVMEQSADEVLIQQLYAERLAAKAVPFAHIEDDVIHALEDIQHMDVKMGLVSNCEPEEVVAWETCRLSGFFDDVVFSYQVDRAKPDPTIYRLACRRLGVQPERSFFVGDGGGDELAGAAQVGMMPYCATWFLERWPDWKRSGEDREGAALYPKLYTPAELVAVVAAKCRP